MVAIVGKKLSFVGEIITKNDPMSFQLSFIGLKLCRRVTIFLMYHCSELERPVGLSQLQKMGPKMSQNLVFPVFGPGETGNGTQLGPNFCNHQRDVGPRYPVPIQGYPMM